MARKMAGKAAEQEVHEASPDTQDEGAVGLDLGTHPDVAELEDQGNDVELFDIHGNPIFFTNEKGEQERVSITVAGTYSNRWRRAEDAVTTRMAKGRQAQFTGELFRAQQTEVLALSVIRWRGIFDQGRTLPVTRDNAMRVFARLPFIHEQVEQGAKNHAAFFRSS